MKVRPQRSDARTMGVIAGLPATGTGEWDLPGASARDPDWHMRDDVSPSAFQRFRDGDISAFAEVVAAYAGPAYSLAVAVLGDRGLAEKAVEDAFVRAASDAPSFDPRNGVEAPWILQHVRDAAVASLRTQSRYRGSREPMTAVAASALLDDDVWRAVMRGATPMMVRSALETLTEAQRETLTLAYWKGLRPDEVASLRGVPQDLVRENLRAALQKVREQLARAVPGVFTT